MNKIDKKKIDELCDIIMRQTNYNKKECEDKLLLHNYNIINVINEYMGIESKTIQKKTSTNQMMYGEFRSFLDNACNRYRFKKEYIERINKNRELFLKNNIVDYSNNIVDYSNNIVD